MEIPVVTIIIPCFNASKYIEKCLQKLNDQEYKKFEVICIDDASSDDTVKIIESFKEKALYNIRIIKNEKNLGPALSRNRGISEVTTEYITFCDSDDWYRNDFLSIMIEKIEKFNADIAFCGHVVINERGHEVKRYLVTKKEVLSAAEAITIDVDSLCMMVVKTKIMQCVRTLDIRNGEDMAIIPLLIDKSNKCIAVRETLYYYFRRSDSASQNLSIKVVNSFVKSFEFIENNISDFRLKKEVEYLGIRNLVYPAIISLLSFSSNYSEADEIVTRFQNKYPQWKDNKYMKKMPIYKKMVLFLIKHRFYECVRFIALIRQHI